MKISSIKASIMPADKVRSNEKIVECKGNGILVLKIDQSDYEGQKRYTAIKSLLSFLYNNHADWKNRNVILSLEKWYKKRTLDMNALLWSLLTIMSVEVYQDKAHDDILYQDMLELYAPREVSELTGKSRVSKTSSRMNTIEMGILLEGIFMQLAQLGVGLSDASQIRNYWIEYYNWRGSEKVDPLSETYANIEDYRKRVCYCEACLKYLGEYGFENYTGQMAHIVSQGAGGSDDLWNRLHLCAECHLGLQHTQGWEKMIEQFPHLEWKIKKAREKSGLQGLYIQKELLDSEKKETKYDEI